MGYGECACCANDEEPKTDEMFQAGDVVRLKSGGPGMTIERVDVLVHCVWFSGYEALSGVFKSTSLKKIPGGSN